MTPESSDDGTTSTQAADGEIFAEGGAQTSFATSDPSTNAARAYDTLWVNARLATMTPGGAPYGAIADGALAARDGRSRGWVRALISRVWRNGSRRV